MTKKGERRMLDWPVIVAVVAAALVVAGAAAVFLLARLRKRPQPPAEEEPGVFTQQPETITIEAAPGSDREFAERAERFEGLYESLHRAAVTNPDADRCRWVLSSWELRVRESGAEALQETWKDALHKTTGLEELGDGKAAEDGAVVRLGERWLELVRGWGMQRDGREVFEMEEDDEERYFVDRDFEPGMEVAVDVPCWTYDGEVIERGIARFVSEK